MKNAQARKLLDELKHHPVTSEEKYFLEDLAWKLIFEDVDFINEEEAEKLNAICNRLRDDA